MSGLFRSPSDLKFQIGNAVTISTERPPGPADILYETEIAPALWKIMSKCAGAGVNMIALVEFEPGKVGHSNVMRGGGVEMRTVMSELACIDEGQFDLDMFVIRHVELALRDGHTSRVLDSVSIQRVPKVKTA